MPLCLLLPVRIKKARAQRGNTPSPPGAQADAFYEPFRLATRARNHAVKATALDGLQKLIGEPLFPSPPPNKTRLTHTPNMALLASLFSLAHGVLCGKTVIKPATDDAPARTLMDDIIATVSDCKDDPQDTVQLQVIKALLTAVTSPVTAVHEASLLMAVRACYHIFLVSNNVINRTTAKATLTQMLNVSFQRMEAFDRAAASAAPAPAAATATTTTAVPAGGAGGGAGAGASASTASATAHANGHASGSGSGAAGGTAFAGAMYATVASTLGIAASSSDAAPLRAADPRTPTRIAVGGGAGGGAGAGAPRVPSTPSIPALSNVVHRDAFLLFRALCKLSMKKEDGDEHHGDPIAAKSKVLSLELLESVLHRSGPSFRSNPEFIRAIRDYLCVSLLQNMVSNVTEVLSLSLKIFVALVSNFKVLHCRTPTTYSSLSVWENSNHHQCSIVDFSRVVLPAALMLAGPFGARGRRLYHQRLLPHPRQSTRHAGAQGRIPSWCCCRCAHACFATATRTLTSTVLPGPGACAASVPAAVQRPSQCRGAVPQLRLR